MMRIADRLARLERMRPATRSERRFVVMPWDPIPIHAENDLVCLYRITDETGTQRVEYERNGTHPRNDAPGSHNHRLYFGETAND